MAVSTHVNTTIQSGVLVARVTTNAISEYEAQVIGTQIKEEAPNASWKIVMDLSDVAHMASAGLGMMIELTTNARKNKGGLVVCSIAPAIHDVLKLTNLNKLFPIEKTLEKAIKKAS